MVVAGAQLANLAAHRDADWAGEALGGDLDDQPAVLDRDLIPVPWNTIEKREAVEAGGQPRAEVQHAVTDGAPDVGALEEVEGPRHHPHVDTLLGRAALDVADVGLQRHQEALPRALRVERGEDRGVRDQLQRRPVRGAVS